MTERVSARLRRSAWDQCASPAAVAARERVDRLEPGVGEGGVRQRGDVLAGGERDQVADRGGHAVGMRREERRPVRGVPAPADPHLPGTPPAGDARLGGLQQRVVQLEDRLGVEALGQRDDGLHGVDVADDLRRVALRVLTELGDEFWVARESDHMTAPGETGPSTRSETPWRAP